MDLVITVFIFLSYFFGSKAILQDKYYPNIYSRIIWLLFALNNFLSVLLLKNSTSVLILAGFGLAGNLLIFLLALKKSKRIFGKTEFVISILLVATLLIWLFTRLPMLNLTIGLIAHFIGGIPTFKAVIKDPKAEDILFWFFFFIASSLTLFGINWVNVSDYIYPLYFAVINGEMTVFTFRRYKLFKFRLK